jgi:Tfp pilus assembly protein PilN
MAPHMLTLPPAPAAEQRRIVGGELARFTAIESNTPFGWMPMASGGGPGGSTLAFLAETEMIAGYRQAITAAGLEMDACEPDAIAALRTVELGLRQPGVAAAVYVSPTCSEIAFMEAGRVRYYRRLDLGLGEAEGSELARSLAGSAANRGSHLSPAGDLEGLALEIKRSLQYYARAYGSAPQPQKVFLLGDSPALEQLAELVHGDLQLEAEYLHPVHLYRHAPEITDQHVVSSGGQYSVALGMALRPLADPHAAFALNMIAGHDARALARRAPRYLMAALSGSTAMALAALAASLVLGAHLSHLRGELNAAQAELQAADTERATTVMQVQQARIGTERLRRQAMPIPQLLTRLGNLVPEAVALTDVQLNEDGSLVLAGDAQSPRQVDRFLQQLADDSRFRSPELDTLDANDQQGLAHFRLQTGLVGYGKAGGKNS